MWLEKLALGVLRVTTPLGPRYLKPSFLQRIYLLWIFRNFQSLPVRVLSRRQLRNVERMCQENRFVSLGVGSEDAPLIGTLEQPLPVLSETPYRRPSASVGEAVQLPTNSASAGQY